MQYKKIEGNSGKYIHKVICEKCGQIYYMDENVYQLGLKCDYDNEVLLYVGVKYCKAGEEKW